MKKYCMHKPRLTRTVPFFGPVARVQNRAAHGNVCFEYTCQTCGAVQLINANGRYRERSTWVPVRTQSAEDVR